MSTHSQSFGHPTARHTHTDLSRALLPDVDDEVAEHIAGPLQPPRAHDEEPVGAHVPVVATEVRVVDPNLLRDLRGPLAAVHGSKVRAPQQPVPRHGVCVVWHAVEGGGGTLLVQAGEELEHVLVVERVVHLQLQDRSLRDLRGRSRVLNDSFTHSSKQASTRLTLDGAVTEEHPPRNGETRGGGVCVAVVPEAGQVPGLVHVVRRHHRQPRAGLLHQQALARALLVTRQGEEREWRTAPRAHPSAARDVRLFLYSDPVFRNINATAHHVNGNAQALVR